MNGMLELFKVGASLILDKSGFDSDIREADAAGKGLSESLSKHMEKAKKVIKGLFSVGAVVAATKAIWNLAKETSAAGDRIDKQSQALGLSRKAYQEWDYILRQSGASIDDMGMALKTMSNAILENSADTAAGLSKLGLSAAQLANMSPEDQFETLVKAFQEMPEGAEKSRLAMQLFGRNAQSLMPLLNSASGSVDELRNRAHDLGLIMSDEDVDSAVAFGDALDDLNAVWTALKQKFGAQLLPGLTKGLVTLANALGRITNSLTEAFKTGDWKGVFATITEEIGNLLPQAIDAISGMILGLFENADKIVDLGISLVNGLVDGVAKAAPTLIAKLPQILSKAWESIKSMGLKLGNVLIDAINAVLGTNIPHIDEIRWPTWDEVKEAAGKAWDKIKEGALTLAGLVFGKKEDGSVDWPTWEDVVNAANEAWDKIKEGALDLAGLVFGKKEDGSVDWPTWEEVLDAAIEAWNGIVAGALSIAEIAGGLVFGRKEDGSVDWPDWDDVSAAAEIAWNGILKGARTVSDIFNGLVFGRKEDGSVDWPTWEDVVADAEKAWNDILQGARTVSEIFNDLIFGRKEDGSVAWPTWEDVVDSAGEAWDTIIAGTLAIGDFFDGLVFGRKEDGSVNFPEWSDVSGAAEQAWNDIVANALAIGDFLDGLVFGRKEDGSVNWPTWDSVTSAAEEAWNGIVAGALTVGDLFDGLIFGRKEDGSVAWPDWDTVSKSATEWWSGENGILSKLAGIFKATFGIDPPDVIDEIRKWWGGDNEAGTTGVLGQISDFMKATFGLDFPDVVQQIIDWWNNTVVAGVGNLLLSFGITPSGGSSSGTKGRPDQDMVNGMMGRLGEDEFGQFLTNQGIYWNSLTNGWEYNAKGLNYVPYDGYRTVLHRGEAVLNASQGREWRQNGGGAGIDFEALAAAVSGAVAEAVSNISLNMDGKLVGSAVAGQVSREITRSLMGRRVPAL